jgi:hypothetical protein
MSKNHRAVPIYTTSGNFGALMKYPYVYNPQGEWIGWVTSDRKVYSVHGHYVGWLTKDPRILRNRTYDHTQPLCDPPQFQRSIRPPATVPLPPMMAELLFSQIDVLDDEPERMPTLDSGEFREDMD